MQRDLSATGGFGIYVHWPFCLSKCPYCDFNSHVRAGPVDEARYIAAFQRELAHRASLAPGRTVDSVFFGGGTPSLMQPQTVAAILDAVALHFAVAENVEITLEANPTSVEADRFRGYRLAGVNRVSLGVQALNDKDLRQLGRLHSVEEAVRALSVARAIFQRYSFDLIYARPAQSVADWRRELERAFAHAAGHLSLYQLTIEPGTVFETLARAGKLVTPDAELGRAMWDVTQELTARHGFAAYEISNHARPGEESRHNLIYWRYGEYIGVGPGAHGRLILDGQRFAQATEKSPEAWLRLVESIGHGFVEAAALSSEEAADEFLLMGLRLSEGIDLTRFERLAGRRLAPHRIESLRQNGLIRLTASGTLAVTAAGLPVLDAVVADLAA
jgi:putative oxygen-independent coproporphyrinogen III oxidase